MTGTPEAALRNKLESRSGQLPQPVNFEVQQVPAQVLSQRPDVASAEQQLAAANADIGVRIAERLPRLALTGNIGPFNFNSSDLSLNGGTWSVGPSLSLPLFDAGRRAANEETAWVAYQTAETKYRSQVRLAVREVEQALVSLESLRTRDDDALIASEGYHVALRAAEEKYNFGLASVLDLEETRRLSFNADNILMSIRRDHVNAWIALYRAVGGGWQAGDLAQPADAFSHTIDQKGTK
jgi:outer membrane protein TolC